MNLGAEVLAHLRGNWLGWLFAVAAFVGGFLIFSFNREVGVLEGKLERIAKQADKAEAGYATILDRVHRLELDLATRKAEADGRAGR